MNVYEKRRLKAANEFLGIVGVAPPTEAQLKRLQPVVGNWLVAHSYIMNLPERKRVEAAAQMVYLELMRDGGPRRHMLDRLYMKMSNLRRELEWGVVGRMLPDEDDPLPIAANG